MPGQTDNHAATVATAAKGATGHKVVIARCWATYDPRLHYITASHELLCDTKIGTPLSIRTRLAVDVSRSPFMGGMMGSFSIWHLLIIVMIVPAFLPLVIKKREGANRYGTMPPRIDPRGPGAISLALNSAFTRVVNFKGRTGRVEFWYFVLLVWLSSIPLNLLAGDGSALGVFGGLVLLIAFAALSIASIAITVRRLHDINRSGWWILMGVTLGWFVLLYWYTRPSQTD